MTPPAALMSSTARSAPLFICAPNSAKLPVIGPAVAIVMSAMADDARTSRPKRRGNSAVEQIYACGTLPVVDLV